MVKRELSQKAKLFIDQSIYIPTLTYGHEIVDTRGQRRFLRRVSGLSLTEQVRSSDIQREISVEPVLLGVERDQWRWFELLIMVPPEHLLSEVFRMCPAGRRLLRYPFET